MRATGVQNAMMTSYQLAQLLGAGEATNAGVPINADTALRISAVFACTRMVAEDIGKLPYPVYRVDASNGDRTEAYNSPYWKLVHDRWMGSPGEMVITSQQGREFMTACAVLRGNGFAWKNAVGNQTYELNPIMPNLVRMEEKPGWNVIYHVRGADGVEKPYTRAQIFHIAGPLIDSWYDGASVVKLGAQGFGLAAAAVKKAGLLFKNDAVPRGLLTTDAKMDKVAAARMKKDWQSANGGDNAGGIAVFEQGLKFQGISLSPADLQLLETIKDSVDDIAARWFRIPLNKVGSQEGMTWHSIESSNMEYTTDTLMGWGVRWDGAINNQIIVGNNLFAELNFDALLRGDLLSRYEAYQSAILTGWMSRAEARRKENMNFVDGLDQHLVPTNEQTIAALAAGITSKGGTKTDG